jgi:hypothetical protein
VAGVDKTGGPLGEAMVEVFDARKLNLVDLGAYQNADKNEVADNEIFRVLSSGRLDIGKVNSLKHQSGKVFA